jgi:hypothetical protein
MAKGQDSPMVYRFDSGYGGWQYTLRFKEGKVTRLETAGLY